MNTPKPNPETSRTMPRTSSPAHRAHGVDGLAPVLRSLACPVCHGSLASVRNDTLHCVACNREYPIRNGFAELRPPNARDKPEFADWSRHWSPEAQHTVVQRFFSWYRKAVFARTVAWHIERHFPRQGLFLEAGSGTSETSIRINKHLGQRTLVALDIVPEVVASSAEVMDVAVAGDIFQLPFQDESIDGAWNVGVMEHFTHSQIDAILCELRRVLRPGGTVILLWPATDSLPQKLLRAIEAVVNFTRQGQRFQFHPDEISKLRSGEQGRLVLLRNGFSVAEVEFGLRSLMAFKTVVGRRPGGAPDSLAATAGNRGFRE